MKPLEISPCILDERCEALRVEVRVFLQEALAHMTPALRAHSWSEGDAEFSRKLGARGWIGMTWPRRYGGQEASALQRYVVLEELLAAGAPVHYHWVADRQSGPLLMRYAPETLAPEILPRIARGECCFAIGMSEPNSGSDLASVATRARRCEGGWKITGSKIWTSFAHQAQYMIALVRTADRAESRHAGLSQFLVAMDTPGITIRPVWNMLGDRHFNEVFLDEVFVPDRCLIGREGEGWKQVTEELSLERSGPERYLSSTQLVIEMLDAADVADDRQAIALGRTVAGYACLRQMSLGVAGMLSRGESPALAATVVKELGANLEQGVPEMAHELFSGTPFMRGDLRDAMSYVTQASPSFSLRGGTREILRGIIAKGLELR